MKRTILMIFTAISICLSGMEAFATTAADNNATVEMTRAEKRKAKKAAKAAEKLRKEKEKQEKKRQQEPTPCNSRWLSPPSTICTS